jgi:hypothetical protein
MRRNTRTGGALLNQVLVQKFSFISAKILITHTKELTSTFLAIIYFVKNKAVCLNRIGVDEAA